jgi:hypothetical protein
MGREWAALTARLAPFCGAIVENLTLGGGIPIGQDTFE